MKRTTKILTEYQDDVDLALERFGDHEDMSEARLVRWLEQFPDEDLTLAVQVIRSIKYFNTLNVQSKTKDLFHMTVGELKKRRFKRICFVAVDKPGSGANIVARVLRESVRKTRHRILSMLDLSRLPPGEIDAIVFVDDFSGTGGTLEKWWQKVEPLVRPIGVAVFVGLLVLNESARERIEDFAGVLAVEELGTEDNVFSNDNFEFSESEKTTLLEHCQRTGCGTEFERGFGQCGLLLSFKHGCPNNSLPVLWYSAGGSGPKWRPLFRRSAI
jgi:hypothetical protein